MRRPDSQASRLRSRALPALPLDFHALFKALRAVQPDFEIWNDFHYEYEPRSRMPIDVINGGSSLREWVDDPAATIGDWDRVLRNDEQQWIADRRP